jgi:site-specific recombinase XerD
MTESSVSQKSDSFRAKALEALFGETSKMTTEDVFSKMGEMTITQKSIIAHQMSLRRNPLGTRKNYFEVIHKFFEITQTSVLNILPHHIDDWLSQLEAEGLSQVTLSNKLSVIKSFFGFLLKTGFLRLNPSSTIKGPRFLENKYSERVLSKNEINSMLLIAGKSLRARDYLICRVLFSCGIRVSECVGLNWGDMLKDIQGRWFIKVSGKGNKDRMVYLPSDIASEILLWRQMKFSVLPGDTALSLNLLPLFSKELSVTSRLSTLTIYRTIKKLGMSVLGRKVTPHSLRHSFATHARLCGATIEQIKEQLGHESIQTTMRYEHSSHLMKPAGEVLEGHWDSIKSV